MTRNLLYYSSFGGNLHNLFITASSLLSAKKFKDDSFDILLYCNVSLFEDLNRFFPGILVGIRVWKSYCSYSSPLDELCWTRYDIFSWIDIGNYDNILYLDTDYCLRKTFGFVFSD